MALRHLAIWLLALSLLVGCPGAADHADATVVLQYVRDKYPFPLKNEPSIGPTIYFGPGVQTTELTVYGIRNAADQEKVIALVREASPKTSGKPVRIVFLDEERFVQRRNGRERSGEIVLRKVTVSD